MYQVSPMRQEKGNVPSNELANKWAQVTAHRAIQPANDVEERVDVSPNYRKLRAGEHRQEKGMEMLYDLACPISVATLSTSAQERHSFNHPECAML
jgi:hypothetical protein